VATGRKIKRPRDAHCFLPPAWADLLCGAEFLLAAWQPGRGCVRRRIAGRDRTRNDFAAVLQFVLTVGDDDVPPASSRRKGPAVSPVVCAIVIGRMLDDISLTDEINVGALRGPR